MKANEFLEIVNTMRAYFREAGTPNFDDPIVRKVWWETFQSFDAGDGLAAANAVREAAEARIAAGQPYGFPTPIEVGRFLKQVATDRERDEMIEHNRSAAITCDGSRWIDNVPGPDGRRPFPSLGEGAVACPTCLPFVHEQQMKRNNHGHWDRKAGGKGLPPCPQPPYEARDRTTPVPDLRRDGRLV